MVAQEQTIWDHVRDGLELLLLSVVVFVGLCCERSDDMGLRLQDLCGLDAKLESIGRKAEPTTLANLDAEIDRLFSDLRAELGQCECGQCGECELQDARLEGQISDAERGLGLHPITCKVCGGPNGPECTECASCVTGTMTLDGVYIPGPKKPS